LAFLKEAFEYERGAAMTATAALHNGETLGRQVPAANSKAQFYIVKHARFPDSARFSKDNKS